MHTSFSEWERGKEGGRDSGGLRGREMAGGRAGGGGGERDMPGREERIEGERVERGGGREER
jgi:hypothetical protein